MSQPICRTKSLDDIKRAGFLTSSLSLGSLLAGALLLLGGCVTSVGYQPPYTQVSVDAEIYQPPPPLPADMEPPCPGDGYLWVPGYWAYSGGYYWVPGSWVLPPHVGLLWTPGYWGFAGGAYVWHPGYWGEHVGFYGGIRYGFGYDGVGYHGGHWEGRHFVYNRYVTNVDGHRVHYTYNERVDRRFDGDRVSYEGGRGGVVAHPTREDLTHAREVRIGTIPSRRAHIEPGAGSPPPFERANSGRPTMASRPGQFPGMAAERARGAEDFGPRLGRWTGQPRVNLSSRPDLQPRPNMPAHPDVQAAPRYQSPPGGYSQTPVTRPQPGRGIPARVGPAPHPQGRPVPERKGRSPRPDR